MSELAYCSEAWQLVNGVAVCAGTLVSASTTFSSLDPVVIGEYFAGGFSLVGFFCVLGVALRRVLSILR